MAQTTGPILAIGAITLGNSVILNSKPFDWKVPIGTGIAAALFALFEKAGGNAVVLLAYAGLVTVLFSRVQKDVPAPAESILKAWNSW